MKNPATIPSHLFAETYFDDNEFEEWLEQHNITFKAQGIGIDYYGSFGALVNMVNKFFDGDEDLLAEIEKLG